MEQCGISGPWTENESLVCALVTDTGKITFNVNGLVSLRVSHTCWTLWGKKVKVVCEVYWRISCFIWWHNRFYWTPRMHQWFGINFVFLCSCDYPTDSSCTSLDLPSAAWQLFTAPTDKTSVNRNRESLRGSTWLMGNVVFISGKNESYLPCLIMSETWVTSDLGRKSSRGDWGVVSWYHDPVSFQYKVNDSESKQRERSRGCSGQEYHRQSQINLCC